MTEPEVKKMMADFISNNLNVEYSRLVLICIYLFL